MDVVCICCGEPWDTDYVVHDEPEGFIRKGAAITACPCCKGKKRELPEQEREKLDAIASVAALFGDDLDGFAATLEDFGLI
jgi:hypothetical protein